MRLRFPSAFSSWVYELPFIIKRIDKGVYLSVYLLHNIPGDSISGLTLSAMGAFFFCLAGFDITVLRYAVNAARSTLEELNAEWGVAVSST